MQSFEEKIEVLYAFLKANRQFNKDVQTLTYKRILLPFENKEDRIISLLHHIVNTQSQPKIDRLAKFFQLIEGNRSSLDSLKNFLHLFGNNQGAKDYISLFYVLKEQEGWGNKTAALFCKSIYHFHCGTYDIRFKIWDDVPPKLEENDKLYLPVDVVISDIFSKLNFVKSDFININDFLFQYYKGNQMEVWDDLWFWGFISQKTIKNESERKLGWNQAKYWALLETNKSPKVIKEVESKVGDFIKIIENIQ